MASTPPVVLSPGTSGEETESDPTAVQTLSQGRGMESGSKEIPQTGQKRILPQEEEQESVDTHSEIEYTSIPDSDYPSVFHTHGDRGVNLPSPTPVVLTRPR